MIARVLTLASGPATIKPDYNEGIAGFSITDVNSCDAEWEKRGKVREPDAVGARITNWVAVMERILGDAWPIDAGGGGRSRHHVYDRE